MPLRLVFMGTPDFAVPTLVEAVGQGHEVAAVYTQPPRPAGRGMEKRLTPVHEAALAFGLDVRTPARLKAPEEQAAFATLEPDVGLVVAYGLLLPEPILSAPRHGCINVHASLLPRWRGAAPIHRAIMAGDKETGVSIMRMDEGLDTGPVAMAERISIGPNETAGDIHDRLMRLGADLAVRALGGLERGALDFRPQPEEGVTYAAKIDKAESRIDWTLPATQVHDHVRGLSPWPGAWCELPGAGRVKLLRTEIADGAGPPGTLLDERLLVACGRGALRMVTVQRSGKGPMDAAAFLRGARVPAGTVVG